MVPRMGPDSRSCTFPHGRPLFRKAGTLINKINFLENPLQFKGEAKLEDLQRRRGECSREDLQCMYFQSCGLPVFATSCQFLNRRPSSGEAIKKPSKPSNAAQDKPANDKKKEPDARERRRKEMMQNQV